MKRAYFCPSCGATLNPSAKVILTARKEQVEGLILLSPQPGNYQVIAADELDLRPGDLLELRCPVCRHGLISPVNGNLAEIGFRMTNGAEGRVRFSRRFGEHATFFVTREEIRSYGEHADVYSALNFFGSGPLEADAGEPRAPDGPVDDPAGRGRHAVAADHLERKDAKPR